MKIILKEYNKKNECFYFETNTIVTAQIGRSTNKDKYIWTIFHPDIKCAIYGGEIESFEKAKEEIKKWVDLWVRK